jgi:hypothetical protein
MNHQTFYTVDKSPEEINMQDVTTYLNAILFHYGPPCDFCESFSGVICKKNLRTRQYDLDCGPYESWTIRKKCKEFIGKDDGGDELAELLGLKTLQSLDCNFQTYCR